MEPLAVLLRAKGLSVWFDKFSLQVGDSLHDSIEDGLANSSYGVVVFSPKFLSKNWPRAELRGLFAREVAGNKVILPVWHEIGAEEILAVLPMMADKVALKSIDGVQHVADKLIEAIRPDLLTVDGTQRVAFDASGQFLDTAKNKYPGYSFAIHAGTKLPPPTAGVIASVSQGAQRIDISIEDKSQIKERPGLKVQFSESGSEKAREFVRTGIAQTWKPGEFSIQANNVPLFPGMLDSNTVLSVKPRINGSKKRRVRIHVETLARKTLPIMKMYVTRAGDEEAEFVIEKRGFPLRLVFVFSPKANREIECSLEWDFTGCSCTDCLAVITAIHEVRRGVKAEIFDLDRDETAMNLPNLTDILADNVPSDGLREVVKLAAQIEDKFRTTLPFPREFSNEDSESLHYLDCLMNGEQHGENLSSSFVINKTHGDAMQPLLVNGQLVNLYLEPTNYAGYFPLFGAKVRAPKWGIYTEKCICELVDASITEFEAAKEGEQFKIRVRGISPTFVRWAKDRPNITSIGATLS